MAEVLHDFAQRVSGGHQVGGVGVPALVQGDAPQRGGVGLPGAVGALGQARVHHARRAEHAPAGGSALAEGGRAQERQQRRGERGAAVGARLALGGPYVDQLRFEVDVGPLEALELGAAWATVEGNRVGQGVRGSERGEQVRGFGGVGDPQALDLVAGGQFNLARRVAGDQAASRVGGPAIDGVDGRHAVVDRRALEPAACTTVDERLPVRRLDVCGDAVAKSLAEWKSLGARRQQRVVERVTVASPGGRRVAAATAALGDRAVLDARPPASGELAEGWARFAALAYRLGGFVAALEPGEDLRAQLARGAVLRLPGGRVAALGAEGGLAAAAPAVPRATALGVTDVEALAVGRLPLSHGSIGDDDRSAWSGASGHDNRSIQAAGSTR